MRKPRFYQRIILCNFISFFVTFFNNLCYFKSVYHDSEIVIVQSVFRTVRTVFIRSSEPSTIVVWVCVGIVYFCLHSTYDSVFIFCWTCLNLNILFSASRSWFRFVSCLLAVRWVQDWKATLTVSFDRKKCLFLMYYLLFIAMHSVWNKYVLL